MKKSDNLFILSICLMMLAIFISSASHPEAAQMMRIIFLAAGIILLCLFGRAERLERKKEQSRESKAQHHYNPLLAGNYSEMECVYNRYVLKNNIDELIEETTKKEQPLK